MARTMFWILFCLIPYQVHSVPDVTEEKITISAFIGEVLNLRCELENIPAEYPIILFHDQRRQYLTNDEVIYDYAPEDLKNRLSVNCYRLRSHRGVCSITIRNATVPDNGTYHCGYINTDTQRVHFSSVITVTLTHPDPPSDNSPICEIFSVAADGTYVSSSSGHTIGDTIYLGCRVRKTSIKPSLLWQRGYDSHAIEMSAIKGLSVRHEVSLTREHLRVQFFCIMNHPNLVSLRNCSLMPLPEILTTTQSTTSLPITNTSSMYTLIPKTSSSLSTSVTQANHHNTYQTIQIVDTRPTASTRQQSLKVPIVIAVLLTTFVLGIGAMLFVVWRRRNRKLKIPSIPNYEMTFERDCSITPEYAVVHAPDSIDKSKNKNKVKDFKSLTALAPQSEKDENYNDNIRNSSHLRESNGIRVDESNNSLEDYENLRIPQGQPMSGESDVQEDNSQLMYADLDLPEVSDEFNNDRIPEDDQDVTLYADIQGTL